MHPEKLIRNSVFVSGTLTLLMLLAGKIFQIKVLTNIGIHLIYITLAIGILPFLVAIVIIVFLDLIKKKQD